LIGGAERQREGKIDRKNWREREKERKGKIIKKSNEKLREIQVKRGK